MSSSLSCTVSPQLPTQREKKTEPGSPSAQARSTPRLGSFRFHRLIRLDEERLPGAGIHRLARVRHVLIHPHARRPNHRVAPLVEVDELWQELGAIPPAIASSYIDSQAAHS